jgi:hypothetical protein
MSKWADYIITAVRYQQTGRDPHGKRIAAVEVHMDLGGRVGYAELWTREQVLDAIHHDHETFITSSMAADSTWLRGAHVRLVRVNGLDYLRMDRASVASDDLGGLPEL